MRHLFLQTFDQFQALAPIPDINTDSQNRGFEFLNLGGNFPDWLVDDEFPDPYILVARIAAEVSQIS